MELKINKISGPKNAFLEMKGTILVYSEKTYAYETTIWIPIELIEIIENKRYRGKRLIKGLLLLLISILSGCFGNIIFFDMLKINEDSVYAHIFLLLLLLIILFGLISCFVFVIMFFTRQGTICLFIDSDSDSIEFWKEKNTLVQIDELINQIKQKQEQVEESLSSTAIHTIGFFDERTIIYKFLYLIFLFSLPAMFTEIPILLLLVLLPIGWFIIKQIQLLQHPKEYRKAAKYYRLKKWKESIDELGRLQNRFPAYLPGSILLAYIYMHIYKFDEVLQITNKLPDEYLDIKQDIQTKMWHLKRIHERMGKIDTQEKFCKHLL